MAAFEYGPRYSNVIAFTVATAVACAIAFFVIVSIALLSGSKEVHAPFLLTLTAVTLASGLIGAITTAGDETKKADAIAEQKGNAAFVFSNATGTFISLVASATEAYEKQSADDSTGLTYFLDTLGIADQRQMLSLYIGALCVLAVLALCLVLSSARLLNRKTEVTRAELDLVRWLSVILLVVGLAASSTWGAIPFGAKEAADIWRTLLLSGFALLGAGFLAHAISSGVGAFISMLAYGVIYLGKQLRSEGVRRQLENGVR